jgi:ketosteroid isomerase-like protein
MPLSAHDLLTSVYAAFNARDLDGVLALLHPDVDWPNGMEDGRVHGRQGVRGYWTRQWGLIDPHVDPRRFELDGSGRMVVDVHQVVRDRAGNIIRDQVVQHVYELQDGLIRRMDIVKP